MEFPIITTGREHVDRFVNEIAPIVCNEYIKRVEKGERRILPCTVIAQAALESGYNINAPTLFGIKGDGIDLDTSEYVNGEYVNIRDSFKVYPTISAAVQGLYDLMQSDRYAPATSAVEYNEECRQLSLCGYATDPNYADKLINIIEKNNLEQYNLYCFATLKDDSESIVVDDDEEVVEYFTDNNGISYSFNDLVNLVIDGYFGNSRETREAAFLEKGFSSDLYDRVQSEVNHQLENWKVNWVQKIKYKGCKGGKLGII